MEAWVDKFRNVSLSLSKLVRVGISPRRADGACFRLRCQGRCSSCG